MADEEYLTPYQRMQESIGLGQRGLEAQTASFETRAAAANPFLEERELVAGPSAVPTAVAAPPPPPNPLIKPPVPLSTMPLAQQIAWQQLQDKTRVTQAELDTRHLDAEIKRQDLELRAERVKQNRELTAEVPKLRQALNQGPEAYLDLKAKLASRFPIGMGSPEMERVLGEYEKIYAKREGVEADLSKAQAARKALAEQRRIDAGFKEAEKYGANVVRDYAAAVEAGVTGQKAGGVDQKIPDPDEVLAKAQLSNLEAILSQRMTPEEKERKYGGGASGRSFEYAAALRDEKTQAALTQERARATTVFATLDKRRAESGFDPTDPAPFTNSSWTPALEEAHQNSLDYMNSLTPKIGGNRGGVAGMERVGALGGQSPYRDYRPVVAQPSPSQLAKPREKRVHNPTTGETLVLRNGAWVPL